MKKFENYENIPAEAQGAVVAIGNFDGVHRGHQALLAQARKIADAAGKKLAVLTFEPHPNSLFRPDEPPFRITPLAIKEQKLADYGVDILYALTFNWDFASQSAEDFLQKILVGGLKASHVVIGEDFRFGQLRKGGPEDIRTAGIETHTINKVSTTGGEKISSSRIRQALQQGNIETANALLGWEWEIWGKIFEGDHRGRALGYPTANMKLEDTLHPAYGVYASLAQVEGEKEWRPAATNIGIRPMFEVPVAQVETFIFDFDREIYGKTLKVKPVRRLRSEARFSSVEELKAQMKKDCAQALEILKE